jgi:hypothetical protein
MGNNRFAISGMNNKVLRYISLAVAGSLGQVQVQDVMQFTQNAFQNQ